MKRSEVRFIEDVAIVEVLHEEGLAVGEQGSPGIRDRGMLESAVGAPRSALEYVVSLADLAAIYAHGLAKNHAFVDGNKRVAFYTMLTFLEWNGFALPLENDAEWIGLFEGIASGMVSRDDLAENIAREIGELQGAGGPIWVDFEPDDDEVDA